MNNRVIVNPQLILEAKLNHLGSYVILNYLMCYHNTDVEEVYINPYDYEEKLHLSNKTIKICLDELVDKKLIERVEHKRNTYLILKKVFRTE